MSYWGQKMFQDSVSDGMQMLNLYHDLTLLVTVVTMALVSFFMAGFIFKNLFMGGFTYRYGSSHEGMEILWVLFPVLWLAVLAVPSLNGLYALEMSSDIKCNTMMKTVGHQWYWSYEYYLGGNDDSNNGLEEKLFSFDSYMLPIEKNLDEVNSEYRVLDVDNRFVLPFKENIQVLVSSEDVMHCWTVPSMAVKVDAVPGRLNLISFISNLPGVVYGQCSEICGANHSAMPIVGEFVSLMAFDFWTQLMSGQILDE